MAKKSGEPKTGYPDFDHKMKLKDANVKRNRFTLVY